MIDYIKRQKSKGIDEGTNTNAFQKLSFLKIPVTIAETSWKDLRLYVRYLDLKCQNPDVGTFTIHHSRRAYQRDIKAMIKKGWIVRDGRKIILKAYQAVWRQMEINRVRVKGLWRYKYWKIPVDVTSLERCNYLKEIENIIRKKVTKRKLSQLRFALKDEGDKNQATFSSKSAASLFGYRSTSSGSKLRQKYFSIVEQTPEESKLYFNKAHGRFEARTKKIEI